MLFFCRQIAKLFHSQLEKAEAPQLFILLISKHGPNVSNVLWWCRDLHRWWREVVIKLASQIKISTSPSACCSLSLHLSSFLHSLLSPRSFLVLCLLSFLFLFLSSCDILFLFHSPFNFHFLLCFTFLCYFPLSRLISFPYFAFFLLHCLSISSSFSVSFLIPLLSSCLTSSHLLSFFVAFWSLVSPYLLFILICLSLSHSLAFLLLMFSTFLSLSLISSHFVSSPLISSGYVLSFLFLILFNLLWLPFSFLAFLSFPLLSYPLVLLPLLFHFHFSPFASSPPNFYFPCISSLFSSFSLASFRSFLLFSTPVLCLVFISTTFQ